MTLSAASTPKRTPRAGFFQRPRKAIEKYSQRATIVSRKTSSKKWAGRPQPMIKTKRGMPTTAVITLDPICLFTGFCQQSREAARSAHRYDRISCGAVETPEGPGDILLHENPARESA